MSNPNKNAVDLINLIKDKFAMRKDIAPVETSSTASRAYKVGDKFYYGNLLQKATQDIAQGTGLAGGVNFENADPVTEQVTSLKETLTNYVNVNGSKNVCPIMNPSDPATLSSWSNYFKINADGSITANGTPSARVSIASRVVLPAGQYIMNGCPSWGNWNSYRIMFLKYVPSETIVYADTGSTPTTITLDEETEILIRVDLYGGYTASNLVYKPMICPKELYDLDPTYEPWAETNQQLTTDKVGMDLLSEVGAANFSTTDITTQTVTNYTFTVNSDKIITVSGTSSVKEEVKWDLYLPSGTYRLSGCPDGGSLDTYRITVRPDLGGNEFLHDVGEGVVFTVNGSVTTRVYITINNGNSQNYSINKTFKPMVAPVEYTGPYVPYAKTNKELTEYVTPKSFDLSIRSSRVSISNQRNFIEGNMAHIYVRFTYLLSQTDAPILTIPNIAYPKNTLAANCICLTTPTDATPIIMVSGSTGNGEVDAFNMSQDKEYVMSGSYYLG